MTEIESPFRAHSGMLGATEPNQVATRENAHFLPPGSVVRFRDNDAVLVHLHDGLWYLRDGCSWRYDKLNRFYERLPGILCHHP